MTMATLKKLLVISKVARSLLGLSNSLNTTLSALSSFSLSSFNWFGPREKKATSAAEVNAEPTNKRIIASTPRTMPEEKPVACVSSRMADNVRKDCESILSKIKMELVDAAKVREKVNGEE
jgi:hypothetical protein